MNASLIRALRRRGVLGTLGRATVLAAQVPRQSYYRWRHRAVPAYRPPSEPELERIEEALSAIGVRVMPLMVDPDEFSAFRHDFRFPADYHGGPGAAVWHEKLLEHFLAWRLGISSLPDQAIYVDVAACTSPWARILREQKAVQAYAIDLDADRQFDDLPYYQRQDATRTDFADASVAAASLQCAFELFRGDDDIGLIRELARILAPGGTAVISPLYMHTHYCSYASPEYWGKGFADAGAREYIRWDLAGIPSSRKYDAVQLKRRILDTIGAVGMKYRLYALRGAERLGPGIYCRFVLEIIR